MSTVIDTGLTTTALKGNFFSALKAANPVWREVASVVNSTGPTENYRWLGTVPQMRQWGTGRLATGLRSESYGVENQKYEATIEVDRDELSDDQLGQIVVRIRELARRAATHPDKLLADMLEHGADSGYTSYDAATFFSASHSSGDSGTQSNLVTLDITTPSTPSADEFAATYQAAVEKLLTIKDDQGEPMNSDLGKLIVLVPANLWYRAKEALTAQVLSSTTNVLAGEASVVVFPRLTSTDRWYLIRTDVEVRPFIFQDREPLEFTTLAEGSEESFKREKYLYGVRARYALAYGYWQYCIRAQFV
ncbi:MAG: Mu-like prophage major head subunit gpT family protein [Phycisphaerae bacterium]